MIRLSKAIFAVGVFCSFDAILQDKLFSRNGFKGVKQFLKHRGELKMLDRFVELELAENALKHWKVKCYDALIEKLNVNIRSNVKAHDENFFMKAI